MIVVSEPERTLSELGETAQDHLRRSPYSAIRRVSCEVRHATLVLHGRLPSYYLKQVAQETVARLDGVIQVVNEVEVEGSPYAEAEWVRSP